MVLSLREFEAFLVFQRAVDATCAALVEAAYSGVG